MKSYLKYFSLLVAILIIIYLIGGFVIIFATLLVLFEKCLYGRISFIPGIEFVTLSTILVVMVYGPVIGVLFSICITLILPMIINNMVGEKWVANKDFSIFSIGFGNIVDIICVFIIHYLRGFDIFWIMVALMLFKHTIGNLEGKFKETNFVVDYLGLIISVSFNLGIIFFFHSFWLSLL